VARTSLPRDVQLLSPSTYLYLHRQRRFKRDFPAIRWYVVERIARANKNSGFHWSMTRANLPRQPVHYHNGAMRSSNIGSANSATLPRHPSAYSLRYRARILRAGDALPLALPGSPAVLIPNGVQSEGWQGCSSGQNSFIEFREDLFLPGENGRDPRAK